MGKDDNNNVQQVESLEEIMERGGTRYKRKRKPGSTKVDEEKKTTTAKKPRTTKPKPKPKQSIFTKARPVRRSTGDVVKDILDLEYNDTQLSDNDKQRNNVIKAAGKFKNTEEYLKYTRALPTATELGIDGVAEAPAALKRNARFFIENTIKTSPFVKSIRQKITALELARQEYDLLGNKKAVSECNATIKELNKNIKSIIKSFKEKTSADYKKSRTQIIQDPRYKEIRSEIKLMEEELKNASPKSLISRLKFQRSAIKKAFTGASFVFNLSPKTTDTVFSFDEDINEPASGIPKEYKEVLSGRKKYYVNVNEMDDKSIAVLEEYYAYNTFLSKLVEISIDELSGMKLKDVSDLLFESTHLLEQQELILEKINKLKNDQREVEVEIDGGDDVTTALFEVFGLEKQSHVPKHILISSNINMVQGIAFNVCRSFSAIHYINDAISAGLVELSKAANDWNNSNQLAKTSTSSFYGIANKRVVSAIKSEILRMQSSGVISGENLATRNTQNTKSIAQMRQEYPMFADLSPQILLSLASFKEGFIIDENSGRKKLHSPVNGEISTSTSSSFSGESDNGEGSYDYWDNINQESDDPELIAQRKEYLQKLFQSLNELFSLFKLSGKNGDRVQTNQKLFSVYDRKLFMMMTGIDYNKEKVASISTEVTKEIKRGASAENDGNYTYAQMADKLTEAYAEDGIQKSFTAPAIAARVKKLYEKIKIAKADNPKLITGLEYIYNFFVDNRGKMEGYEELVNGFDEDTVNKMYTGNELDVNVSMGDLAENDELRSEILGNGDSGTIDETIDVETL